MPLIKIDKIRLDGGTQIRTKIDQSIVNDYAERWKAGAKFLKIMVYYDGTNYWCADGFHRILGAIKAGLTKIDCEVRSGNVRFAILYACGCNEMHGLKRNNADRRNAVLTLLNDPEWSKWSDSEIARQCDVSSMTVGRHRPKSIPNNVKDSEQSETRLVNRGGATYEQKVPKPNRTQTTSSTNGTAHSEPVASTAVTDEPQSEEDVTEESEPSESDDVPSDEQSSSEPESKPLPPTTKVCLCCGGSGRVPTEFKWSAPV